MPLKIGQKAPDFTLPSSNGQDFEFYRDCDKEPVILFFYPKDFTPGCTKEVCSFRDQFQFFKGIDIKILGISTDSVEDHINFKNRYKLPFDLLSDTKGSISKKYKSYIPFLNISRRCTYLIDKNKTIAAVHNELFGAENHIKEMINHLTLKE